jgi:hypothetical protein
MMLFRSTRLPFALLALVGGLLPSGALGQGSIVSWGYDFWGQVSGAPTGTEFAQIACGSEHAVALRTDGTLESWGSGQFGQLSGTPSGPGFTQVVAGNLHSAALRSDGSIVSWGHDQEGQVFEHAIWPGIYADWRRSITHGCSTC